MDAGFDDVITTVDELERVYRAPHELAVRKKHARLDESTRSFIAASPFVLIGTCDRAGRCDVSPRGGPRGFVAVLDDHRLALPDLNGNNLLDSLRNVIDNPHVGLLFVVPGRDESLRVEGRACITTSAAVLDRFTRELRRPVCALGVEVECVFLHCAKAFRRGQMWDPAAWPGAELASAVDLWACQLQIEPIDEAVMEAGYAAELAADRPD